MWLDILHVVRLLRRSPASAAATILTLVLTLGAGASIFAVVDAVLLTPPPFADPDALVTALEAPDGDPAAPPRTLSYGTFEAWRDRAGSRATLEATDGTNLTLTGVGAAERVNAVNVTPGYFKLLGVSPTRGRDFDDGDVARPVVIISDRFWRTKLGGDAGVLGRELVLSGQAHTVIGVLPTSQSGVSDREIWRPFPITPAQAVRNGNSVGVVARLADPMTAADLARVLDDVSRSSAPPSRAVITPLATTLTGGASRMLTSLAGAGALAMLIAFANLGGLLTVRAIDRRRELAVRSALGAQRMQIARHLLFEAQVLVLIGIVGGVVLAVWLTPIVARFALEQFDIARRQVTISWSAIGAVSMMAIALAWICGAVPAGLAARRSAVDVLRRGVTPLRRELLLRRAFVVGEIALAFVLLVSMAMVGRSLFGVLAVNPGFDASGVLAMNISLPGALYPEGPRTVTFYSAVQSALETRLGPGTTAIIDEIPLTGDRRRRIVRGSPASPDGIEANARSVNESYFHVMRIPLLAGRAFDARDNASGPARVIVSRSIGDRLFAGASAIGRTVYVGSPPRPAEIVGVVGDVKQGSLDEATVPTLYVPFPQEPSNGSHAVIRSALPDAVVVAALREEVARLDRDLPVYGVRSMADVVSRSRGVPARRVLAATFSGFAVLAVVLCGIGLMGIVAHDVAARRTELALRLALGANPQRLLGAAYLQGATVLGAGLLAGGAISYWTIRALGSAVSLRSGFDPLSIGLSIAVLVVVCACAIFPTARRASRTDPALALRGE
jgi:putative ABC transport system permease protein